MARRMANKAAVESIRKRLGLNLAEFSEALGFGQSAYADMLRTDRITETAALAAECLSRRQSPGAASEVMFMVRIVRGVPVITLLDGDVRRMTLDGETFILIPAEESRPRPVTVHPGNGAERPVPLPEPPAAWAAGAIAAGQG
jgi:hypothetical protein